MQGSDGAEEPWEVYYSDWADKIQVLEYGLFKDGDESSFQTLRDFAASHMFVPFTAALCGIKRTLSDLQLDSQPRLTHTGPKAYTIECHEFRLPAQGVIVPAYHQLKGPCCMPALGLPLVSSASQCIRLGFALVAARCLETGAKSAVSEAVHGWSHCPECAFVFIQQSHHPMLTCAAAQSPQLQLGSHALTTCSASRLN